MSTELGSGLTQLTDNGLRLLVAQMGIVPSAEAHW